MFEELYNRLMFRRAFDPPPPLDAPLPEPAKRRRAMRMPDRSQAIVEWIDSSDAFRRETADVQDSSDGGLGLWLSVRLTKGWPVLVEHRGFLMRGVVRHANESGGRWLTGLQVVRDERRRSDRFPYHSPARITWEEHGDSREAEARIIDASEGGVQIALGSEVSPATVVCVFAGGWQRFGTVAYARSQDNEFRLGIHFSGDAIPQDSPDYED